MTDEHLLCDIKGLHQSFFAISAVKKEVKEKGRDMGKPERDQEAKEQLVRALKFPLTFARLIPQFLLYYKTYITPTLLL